MIYVLLLENVATQKQVYFIGNAPIKYDDGNLLVHFIDTNIMTCVNYNFLETIEWREDDVENETLEVILEYINKFGRNDEHGRYNVIWDSKIICNAIFYARIKQLQRYRNPFL